MAEGIAGGLADMLAKMGSIKEMVQRDAEQEAQQQAQQDAQQQAQNESQMREFGAFVETAYMIAAADGNPTDAEIASLSRGVSQLTEGRHSEDDIRKMVQAAAERLETEGKQARISAVSNAITDPGLRRSALLVGAGLAWLDRGVGEKEGLTLQAISKAFEIPMNEMHQLLAQAKA